MRMNEKDTATPGGPAGPAGPGGPCEENAFW